MVDQALIVWNLSTFERDVPTAEFPNAFTIKCVLVAEAMKLVTDGRRLGNSDDSARSSRHYEVPRIVSFCTQHLDSRRPCRM